MRYVELEFIAGCTRWRVWVTSFGHYTLGRHRDTDIRIPDRGVSRRHGRLSWTGESLTIENLSESSGISVNRNLLRGPAPIKNGDVLEPWKSWAFTPASLTWSGFTPRAAR